MPILFDWGTYNSASTLEKSALLGMKLTELPPHDLTRRRYGDEYFREYASLARQSFTTITAHGPYYNLVAKSPSTQARVVKAFREAARRAVLAGAEVFNIHLGWRIYHDNRDIDAAADTIKAILEVLPPNVYLSLEVTYTRYQLGTFEDIRAIMEKVGDPRLTISNQLENSFILLTGIYETGNFVAADKMVDKSFWLRVLEETERLSRGFLSLRFSQVTGVYFGGRLLKKRTPLGAGYPRLEPLAEALAEYLVRLYSRRKSELRAHIIYTGPWETKYEDSVRLYYEIARRAATLL